MKIDDIIIKEFEIEVIVKHNGETYKEERKERGQGCNHIANIAGVADYMGQMIYENICKDIEDR